MNSDAAEHAIYFLASECDVLFKQTISALPNETASTYRPLLEYYQRFELWTGYLGALAQPEFSLDRRVQFNEDVRQTIVELLRLIRTNLARGKHCNKRYMTDTAFTKLQIFMANKSMSLTRLCLPS